MVQTVKIRKGEKIIRVHFMYNPDLVSIMREHNGWWFRKEKAWQFPVGKLSELRDHLVNEKYNVQIIKLEEKPKESAKETHEMPKQVPLDMFKNPDVISVPGHCKSCGQYHYLNREGFCLECRVKKKL